MFPKRKTAIVAAMVASGLALSACAGAAGAAPEPEASGAGESLSGVVTYAGYGGTGEDAARDAWYDPFFDDTGVEVLTDSPVTWARVQEMVAAGNVTWDVVQGDAQPGLVDNPDLEMIDCEIVDCAAYDDAIIPAYPQGIPLYIWANVVTYNTDAYDDGEEPNGYEDFFDPDFPGTRLLPTYVNGWWGVLEAALLYDGVERGELYPLDVDRALGVIDGIRDNLIVASDNAQCITQIASGEADMGVCFSGRSALAVDEGLPVDIAWGQQVQGSNYLYIPKGAPNPENAQHLIAYMSENNGRLADYIAYGPVNPDAEIDPDSAWAQFVPTENELDGDLAPIRPNDEWWSDNRPDVIEAIAGWL